MTQSVTTNDINVAHGCCHPQQPPQQQLPQQQLPQQQLPQQQPPQQQPPQPPQQPHPLPTYQTTQPVQQASQPQPHLQQNSVEQPQPPTPVSTPTSTSSQTPPLKPVCAQPSLSTSFTCEQSVGPLSPSMNNFARFMPQDSYQTQGKKAKQIVEKLTVVTDNYKIGTVHPPETNFILSPDGNVTQELKRLLEQSEDCKLTVSFSLGDAQLSRTHSHQDDDEDSFSSASYESPPSSPDSSVVVSPPSPHEPSPTSCETALKTHAAKMLPVLHQVPVGTQAGVISWNML